MAETEMVERESRVDLSAFHRQMDEAMQEMVPADLKAAGWRYVDLPTRLSLEMWDNFLSVLGEGNFRILVMSEGPDWRRGQFFLAPAAYENMRKHIAALSPPSKV